MTEESNAPDDSGAAPPVDGQPPEGSEAPDSGAPPEGSKKPDGGTVLTDDEGPQGAPEEYADFAVPDGMEINTELLEQATPLFKELGLSQIQSQKLVDMYAAQQQAEAQASSESYSQTVKDWVDEAKSDTEIGGDKFDENVGIAKRGIDKFGTPKLVEVLEQTGLGSHPEFIRLFTRVGKLISEDDPGSGEPPVDATDPATVLYPNEAKRG